MDDNGFNLIYSYSRKQAIEDGVLVDVTPQALEKGFKLSVAVTDHLFHGYVVPPDGLEGEGQSAAGRLHDLLMMTLFTADFGLDREIPRPLMDRTNRGGCPAGTQTSGLQRGGGYAAPGRTCAAAM